MDAASALTAIPNGLRDELLNEYRSIIQNYSEHRWSPAELSAGRFCEVVYSILSGYGSGSYPPKASKPDDFVNACRRLESNKHVPRSFQILIPRTLPSLYEVRNNRGVGHVGSDVDSNHMDSTFVVSASNWILAELVRVFHNLSIEEAQQLVDAIAERRVPLIWHGRDVKRVLDPKIEAKGQLLLLLASSPGRIDAKDLRAWTEYKNVTRFMDLLKELHKARLIEFYEAESKVEILPPGSLLASKISDRYRPNFLKAG
ncbi:MAG TPA: hypothetical protein VKP67_29105 [Xanthobacteraceae bacterium]|nr:hypothetical protein [Xanthobacteraceae bacterium]